MGKIILEFDSQEEAEDARTALDGWKWKHAMWELDQELRGIEKYAVFNGREATEVEQDMANKVRESLRDLLQKSNLNLD